MTNPSHENVPLSRHRMFPVIVASWFGALLGIGSFAVRTSVLENAVLALRIDALVPAAVPPLGLTARGLLALAFMVAGGVIGFVLARLVARLGARRGHAPSAAAREAPLANGADSAAEAGEDDDLARLAAARAPLPQRRRALTMDDLPELAPAPPAERIGPSIFHVGELDAASPFAGEQPASAAAEPATAAPKAMPAAPMDPAPAAAAAAMPAPPLGSLGIAELVERFALALAARRARQPRAAAEAGTPGPAPEALPARIPAPFADASIPAATAAPEGLDARPFAMPSSLREPGLGSVEWFDEAEEEATLDSLLPPKRPLAKDPFKAAATAALNGSGTDAGEPEYALAGEDEPDPLDDAADDAAFSSLLDMKPSARQPAEIGSFVRIEEGDAGDLPEPVVVFPGQSVPPPAVPARLPGTPFGASPVATEAALREALSALQKMSGAG